MSTTLQSPPSPEIVYPDSDGLPMAENTVQYRWIVTIQGGLDVVFLDEPNVFVAGDLFWYPVEGNPAIRTAPDVLVAFGRPKGDRGSYQQWREGRRAPQVVFEIDSPSNRPGEMESKFQFYERYGVEEYYRYNPQGGQLWGWLRSGSQLQAIAAMNGWVSPRLQVRFELAHGELVLYGPDGRKFATYTELALERAQEQRAKEQAQRQAEDQAQRAVQERQQREQAQRRAEDQAQRAVQAQRQAEDQAQRAAQAQRQAAQERQQREQAQRRAEDQAQRAVQAQRQAEDQAQRAAQAQRHAEDQAQRAEQAQRQAAQERQQREQAQRQAEDQAQRAERLAAQLRALGIEPES